MADRFAVTLDWEGDCFRPVGKYWAEQCDKHFVIGERYVMVEEAERSDASHKHFFAALKEAWRNLREDQAVMFPTVDHLRAHALIKAGYCNERRIVAANNSEALMLSTMVHQWSPYAVIEVSGNVVTIWEAMSQSRKAMGKARFEDSKTKCLDIAAGMIGVSTADLTDHR